MRTVLHLLASLSAAFAQTQPPALNTSDITIVGVTHSGNGCPQGTMSTSFSADRKTITLSFSAVQIFVGPGTNRLDSSKNCVVRIQLRYPPGWAFSIPKTRWHGIFTIPAGILAKFWTTFEILSRDLEVVSFPAATLNGTSPVTEKVFTQELDAVVDAGRSPLRSICAGPARGGNATSFGGDIIVAHDRWSLTGLKSDVSLGDSGWIAQDIPLVQQVELQWEPCK